MLGIDTFFTYFNINPIEIRDNLVKIPLPGVKKQDINVTIVPDEYVKVEYKDENDPHNSQKSLKIDAVGHSNAKAEYRDGLLKISFPEPNNKAKIVDII